MIPAASGKKKLKIKIQHISWLEFLSSVIRKRLMPLEGALLKGSIPPQLHILPWCTRRVSGCLGVASIVPRGASLSCDCAPDRCRDSRQGNSNYKYNIYVYIYLRMYIYLYIYGYMHHIRCLMFLMEWEAFCD